MTDERLQSTTDDILTGRAIPPQMLQDFLEIAKIDRELCGTIAAAIGALPGLVDSELIEDTVRLAGADIDNDAVDSVVRAVLSVKRAKLDKFLESVHEWVRGRVDRASIFTPDILSRLRSNMEVLIQDCTPIALMQKAEQLLRDVGNEIDSVKFVCDLRPVFNDPRKNVEAFILVTTMRLIYQEQHGEKKSCEIAFSEDELKDLGDDVTKAIEKLGVLNKLRSNLKFAEDGVSDE
ncbi:MAG: hypothetical protein NTU79_20275 [Planctomycetota bacterium]|nr:hypothetical protein [Planctomycetota bacterium]